MPRTTTSDPLDDVPEFSPVDSQYKVADIAVIEVHRETHNGAGHKRWKAVLGDWKPHCSLADIKAVAGGGTFRICAKRPGNRPLFTVTRTLDGKPRDSSDDDDEPEEEPDDIDDADSDVRAIIKQQSIVLPAAFTSITAALVQGSVAHGDRMMAMTANQQALVVSHSAQLAAVQQTADARIDGYRAEADRLRAQLADMQKRMDTLTGENAGYLKTLASGASGNQWVDLVKQVMPELPKIRAMLTSGKPDVPTPQLPAPAPTESSRMKFGGI